MSDETILLDIPDFLRDPENLAAEKESALPACYDADYVESLKSSAILADQTADDYWRLICELREGLQELYALRGEDELVAKICSPLIDKTAP